MYVKHWLELGCGHFILVDNDKISATNLNRQIIALHSTIGKFKTQVMKERILDINKCADVVTYEEFFMPETQGILDKNIDYVIDAIDTVTAKIELIIRAKKLGLNIISCMGTGNKLEPNKFEIADISKTTVCPLAKVVRKELKNRHIENVKVLFSKEEPKKIVQYEDNKRVPGSIAFVPSVAGLLIASEVVKDLVRK